MNELTEHGFSKADARELADAAGEGKTLVAAQVSDAKAEQVAGIMGRYEASGDDDSEDNGKDSGEAVPIVEEELSIGKGKVANGGVRVSSSVSETPVEKKVTLREEHVEAKRKPADRTLGADEAEAAFEEKTVEVMGTKEETEVQKLSSLSSGSWNARRPILSAQGTVYRQFLRICLAVRGHETCIDPA